MHVGNSNGHVFSSSLGQIRSFVGKRLVSGICLS